MELQYERAWQDSELGRPLSLSLPFNLHGEPIKGDSVANYFDNLLPDSTDIRKRVALRFKTGSLEPFDLLRAIGRDCAGAIQLLAEGEYPAGLGRIEGVEMSEEDIERHLLEVVSPEHFGVSPDPEDDFRISLAGAQEKDAYLRWGASGSSLGAPHRPPIFSNCPLAWWAGVVRISAPHWTTSGCA